MASAYSFKVTHSFGSITAITDATGNLVESLSYDPWGRRRNPSNWNDYNVTSTMFDRGFTGHEHLPQFGLINMNGRVYDPFLARFLSPDPYVQAPDYSQNFNRYSYAFNNPLKYSDPDGEWVHLVVGAAIGGVFNWLSNGAQFNAKGLGYFGVGALAGALGAGIGAGFGALASGAGTFGFSASAGLSTVGFGAGFASGTGAGFASGLVTGTGNSLVNGDSFSKAMNSGLNSAFWGGTIGGITGGISGGVRARRMGNDFWSGNSRFKAPELDRVDLLRNDALGDITTNSAKSPLEMYVDSELVFDGDNLYFNDRYSNYTSKFRDSWSAVSGPYGNGQLPQGEWVGYSIVRLDPTTQPNFNSYSRDGFDFWMRLNPLFETYRKGIGIHPDGGVFGTSGCIGLTGDSDALQRFYNTVSRYLGRIGSIGLIF
jgi:RHS repeat-associated protein